VGQYGLGFDGFGVRGATANGFRTTVNGSNIELGDAQAWNDSSTWVFFAVTYDGAGTLGNLNYYRGYRNESEAGANPLEATQTTFGTHALGTTRPSAGFSMGNRTDDFSRAFDGMLDNIRVFGSRDGGGAALSVEQVEAIRAYDMATAHVAGDYNSNGVVESSDYNLWRSSFGSSSYLYADGDGNGLVDAADYIVWRKNLSTSLTGTAGTTTVPEPTSLVGLAAIGVGFSRSWRRMRPFRIQPTLLHASS
jgi:hypothetical protein